MLEYYNNNSNPKDVKNFLSEAGSCVKSRKSRGGGTQDEGFENIPGWF